MKLILFTTILVTLAASASSRSMAEPSLTIDEVIEEAGRISGGSNEEATGIDGDARPKIIDGDIAVRNGDRQKRQAVEYLSQRWPNGEIPYDFGSSFTTDEMSNFNAAVADYEQFTCLRLVPRTTQEHYVNVIKDGGCWSWVGYIPGHRSPQGLSLSEGCLYSKRITIHEFLHAAGLFHQQSRADRDGYVDIIWENIRNGTEGNFAKHETALLYDLPYDYRSVMHYGQAAFGDPRGSITIETKDPAYQTVIGTAQTFSMGDIKMVNEMYGCNDDCDSSIVCQEDQFLGPECKCYCASSDPAVPGVICDTEPEPTTTTAAPTTTTTAAPTTTTTTAVPTTTTTTAAPTTTTTTAAPTTTTTTAAPTTTTTTAAPTTTTTTAAPTTTTTTAAPTTTTTTAAPTTTTTTPAPTTTTTTPAPTTTTTTAAPTTTTTTAAPTTTTTTAAPTTTTTMPQNQCTELNKPCGCKDTNSVNNCDMLENSECKNKKDFCKCKRGFKPNSDNTGCELPECNAISIAKKSTCLCKEGKKCAGVKKTECVKKKNGGFKCKCKKPLQFRDGKCKCKDGFKFRKGKCIKK